MEQNEDESQGSKRSVLDTREYERYCKTTQQATEYERRREQCVRKLEKEWTKRECGKARWKETKTARL